MHSFMAISMKRFAAQGGEGGLKKSKCDYSVFYRPSTIRSILLVVHFKTLKRSDYAGIFFLKSFLHAKLHTKDFGQLKFFLGVEIEVRRRFFYLREYILDLLEKTEKLVAKHYSTPMVPNVHLMKDDGYAFDDRER